jgi:hypothetical protein
MSLTYSIIYNTVAAGNLTLNTIISARHDFSKLALLKGRMPQGPEDIAREQVDRMLMQAAIRDAKAVNLYAKQGMAIREFEMKPGYGTADYLLCSSIVLTSGSSAVKVSDKVKQYCIDRQQKFNGKIYCYEHQKTVG